MLICTCPSVLQEEEGSLRFVQGSFCHLVGKLIRCSRSMIPRDRWDRLQPPPTQTAGQAGIENELADGHQSVLSVFIVKQHGNYVSKAALYW